jgi:hypothetical protein
VIKRSFLVAKSMGLHLNSKTVEVVRVDPHSQGSAVRVGWRVVAVNGDATRNAYDLKHALAKLRDAPTTPGEQSARPAEVHWAFRSGRVGGRARATGLRWRCGAVKSCVWAATTTTGAA